MAILLTACPQDGGSGGSTYAYVCANGTPAEGDATADNINRCERCASGFTLTAAQTCVQYAYVCDNGTPSGEDATADNITKCERCAAGYVLTASETCNHAYVCSNGTPVDDTDATAANITKCQRCSTGYVLTEAEACNHAYVCNNGIPSTDTDAAGANITKCTSCTTGFILTAAETCVQYAYVCENGTPVGDDAPAANINKCASCHGGFKKSGDNCVATQYICTHGTVDSSAAGKPSGNEDEERCSSCNGGFKRVNTTCVATQYTCANGTLDPAATGKPSGNQDEERCSVCNCGFTKSGTLCQSSPVTVTVGSSTAVTCPLVKATDFNVTVGAKVDGLVPVYQYHLGTGVEVASIHRGSAVVPQARYLTACPASKDATVDLNPLDIDDTGTSICDGGYTLFAPTEVGSHRITLRPSGSGTANVALRVKDTGLTQLPYGAGTQVGPNFTKYWYYIPVAVGSTNILMSLKALEASGTGNTTVVYFYSLKRGRISQSILSDGTNVGTTSTIDFDTTISASNAMIFVSIQAFTQSGVTFTLLGLDNRHTLSFCQDNNNNGTCD